MSILMPRDASKFVTDRSQDVKINYSGVKATAEKIATAITDNDTGLMMKRFKAHQLNPNTTDQAAVDWIFFVDVLNFSFWSDDANNKMYIDYGGKRWTGYWALCAAVNRAIEEGTPITDPKYFSAISLKDLKYVMRSDSPVEMPLMQQRLEVLHAAGKTLLEKYEGSFINVISRCQQSAIELMKLTVAEFPSFKDEAEFQGQKIAIYKRVQILIGDIWACCEGEGFGTFNDIDEITMFADYRIPQALVWFGAMEYSDRLLQKLRNDEVLPNKSREEVEIRACSIWAVELLVEEVRKIIKARDTGDRHLPNAILLDHYLWDYRRDNMAETDAVPFHRTRCIYY